MDAATLERAARELAENGYTIIEGVLSEEKCQQYRQCAERWINSLSDKLDLDKPETIREHWLPNLNGIITVDEAAHQDWVWRIRAEENIRQVFAALYGTDKLLSSIDRFSIMPPWSLMRNRPERDLDIDEPTWLHFDQGPGKQPEGRHCVQGLVNLVPVTPQSGTLLVKRGSHRAFKEHFERFPATAPGDFQPVLRTPDERQHWREHYESVRVEGGAGSLFLWDSRTAHQNIPPKRNNRTDWRYVVYTCYQPRALATPADLELKKKAFDEYLMTAHWPAESVRLFGRSGQEAIFKLERTRDRLTADEMQTVRRLAGIDDYPEGGEEKEPMIEWANWGTK